jgi:uncharacterized protein
VIAKPISICIDDTRSVSALFQRPADAHACLVLAHGAGAGMHHSFLDTLATELDVRGVATLRYQFPYMERGSRRPDPPRLAQATVRAAVTEARTLATGMPLFAGGKSFGGRMTSQAQAADPLPDVRGLVFIGFPLHPAGKPSATRFDHVRDVAIPMLFLQGTRDALADLELLEPRLAELEKRATLQVIEHADHSFHVPARSGRRDAEVIADMALVISDWTAQGIS